MHQQAQEPHIVQTAKSSLGCLIPANRCWLSAPVKVGHFPARRKWLWTPTETGGGYSGNCARIYKTKQPPQQLNQTSKKSEQKLHS